MKIELAPVTTDVKMITYAGQEFPVPADTQYVGLNYAHFGKTRRTLLVAWNEKPNFHQTFSYQGGTILAEVKDVSSIEKSLRKVAGHTTEEILLSNAEELSYKTMNLLAEDLSPEEMIHKLYCPEHGIHTEFTAHQQPTMNAYAAELAKANAPAKGEAAPVESKPQEQTQPQGREMTKQELAEAVAYAISRGYKPH